MNTKNRAWDGVHQTRFFAVNSLPQRREQTDGFG
jgi:hypothetical protein